MSSGWNVKQLIKTMLLSETYSQAVVTSPEVLEKDPENAAWTRASSHRWPAETLRDQALAVAGLLDARAGGPPVKPYDLAEAFAALPVDRDSGLYRRSLYTYWKRMSPSPVMIALDAGKRDVCQVKRERTTTPAQSLVFLNSPQFVEAARALADSVWAETGEPDAAIDRLFERLLARQPKPAERQALTTLYRDQYQRFEQDLNSLDAYLQVGQFRIPAEAAKVEIGSLAVVANALMGLEQWTTRR